MPKTKTALPSMSPPAEERVEAEPAPPTSRTAAVHQALRQAIIEQSLKPGMRLPEDAIGESFGASRTIAREALGRLAVEGLVELIPNRGAFVANPTLEEGREVFEVRRGLERTVVAALAGRIGAADVKRLRAFNERERAAQDELLAVRLAGEFHLQLAQLTGNRLLERYVTEVVSRCSLVLAMYGRPHSNECAVNEHAELIDAIADGDAARAITIMDDHLAAVASRALLDNAPPRDIRDVLAPYAQRIVAS